MGGPLTLVENNMVGRGIEIEKPERAVAAVVVDPEAVESEICYEMSLQSSDGSCSTLKDFYWNSYWPCVPFAGTYSMFSGE